MSTPTMDDAAKVLADPTAYADDARLHAALTHLRANNPVALVDNPPYRPFWAETSALSAGSTPRVRGSWSSWSASTWVTARLPWSWRDVEPRRPGG